MRKTEALDLDIVFLRLSLLVTASSSSRSEFPEGVTQNDIFDFLTGEERGYDPRDRPMPFGEVLPVEVRRISTFLTQEVTLNQRHLRTQLLLLLLLFLYMLLLLLFLLLLLLSW